MKIEELDINEDIKKKLLGLGFENFTEIQEKAIPVLLSGKDFMGRSVTGSGKTFAYGIPIIMKAKREDNYVNSLVICPTRELASQVTTELKKIATDGINVTPVYGGADFTRQVKAIKTSRIIVGTPGRLIDHINRKTLKLHNVNAVVLDEADEMLDMGFREDIETILKSITSAHQTIMFSATFPADIKRLANTYMQNAAQIEVGEDNSTITNMKQIYVSCEQKDKKACLLELLKKFKPEQAIIFCNTKRMVEELSEFLTDNLHSNLPLHGDMMQRERRKVFDKIKTTRDNILVATDVAARGIDINNVDFVINFDLPTKIEYYIHRVGRTARAGKSGTAISMLSNFTQLKALRDIEKLTKAKVEKITLENVIPAKFETENEWSKDKVIENRIRRHGDSRSSFRSGSRSSSNSSNRSSGTGERSSSSRFSDSARSSSPRKFGEKSFGGSERNFDRSSTQESPRRDYSDKKVESVKKLDKVSSYEFNDSDAKVERTTRDEFADKKEFNKKPFEKFEKKSDDFSREKKPFTRSGDSERRPYVRKDNSYKSDGEKKPYGERKPYGDRKPFGEKRESFGERKPYGDRKSFGDKKPFGDRKPFGEKRESFGDKKPFGDKRESFGERKPYGDRKPFGDKKSFGDRKPFGEKKFDDAKSEYKPKRSFGEKSDYKPKRTFGEDKPKSSFKKDTAGKSSFGRDKKSFKSDRV